MARVSLEHPRRARHPGRSGLTEAVVDCALYCGGHRRTPEVLPVEQAAALAREGGGFVWLGLHEPDEQALADAVREFGLEPLAVEDAVHAHQRPKLDVYRDHLFVVLKSVRYVDTEEVVETGELMLFVGADHVVTVRHGCAPPLDGVRRELEAHPELLALGPSAVLWAVLDAVVDGYVPAVDGLEQDVDEVEDAVFADDRRNPTKRIYELKREVLEFGRAVHPLVPVTERLAAGDLPRIAPGIATRFQDVHDHVLRAHDAVAGLDALLGDALDANIAQVTLQQNDDMRKISAWVAIAGVSTLVAGIYGMNFRNMPELHWRYGYGYALLLMSGLSLLLWRGFKRNGWL